MYKIISATVFWNNIETEIAAYVLACLTNNCKVWEWQIGLIWLEYKMKTATFLIISLLTYIKCLLGTFNISTWRKVLTSFLALTLVRLVVNLNLYILIRFCISSSAITLFSIALVAPFFFITRVHVQFIFYIKYTTDCQPLPFRLYV